MSRLLGRITTLLGLRLVPMWVGDLALAIVYGISWAEPYRLGEAVPGDLSVLLLFEGLAIHSTPFVYVVRVGVLSPWFLTVYVPFALVVGYALEAPLVLALFLWHLASTGWQERMSEGELNVQIVRYVVVVLAFFGALLAGALLPLPDLGWVEGAVPSDLAWETGSGELRYRAVPVMGTLYFTARAAWHLLWWRWERGGELVAMERQAARSR